MNVTRNLVRGALVIAFGILVPMIFHSISLSGAVFLPMHLSVLIGAAFISPRAALVAGALTPLISSIMTGMPPLMPIGILMSFELAAYGLCMAYLIQVKRMKIIVSLIAAMTFGRVILAFGAMIVAYVLQFELIPILYLKTAIMTGFPGLLLQLFIVPTVIRAIGKSQRLKELILD